MTEADSQAFTEALYGVFDHYRQARPQGFSLRMWWESLKAYELEAVLKALVTHVNLTTKDARFPPSVAGLKEIIGGSINDSASGAWVKVTQAVQRVGTGTTVVFDDALIHRCVEDIGGWIWLGQQTEEEWPFIGRNFEQRYRAYAGRGERPDYPGKLLGHYDSGNGQQGHLVARPTFIGDQVKCALVLERANGGDRLLITPPERQPALPESVKRRGQLAVESR